MANLYLNEVDEMLERAREKTREGQYTHIEYARFADDLVILVDGYRRWEWLYKTLGLYSDYGVRYHQNPQSAASR